MKKIDTIFFDGNGVTIEIQVFFEKGSNAGFISDLPEYGIHKLKFPSLQELEAELNKLLLIQTTINWKSVLHIQANYSPSHKLNDNFFAVKFDFTARPMQTGINSAGEYFSRSDASGRAIKGEIKEGASQGREPSGREIFYISSVIDDTPENRKVLRSFYNGFSNIFEMINFCLSPEKIQKTINGTLSGVPLLPERNTLENEKFR